MSSEKPGLANAAVALRTDLSATAALALRLGDGKAYRR